jgi:hypothetical protein
MITFIYILIGICFAIAFLQKTKEHFLSAFIFCLIAILPEFNNLEGLEYIAICALSAIVGCILIASILPRTIYALNIMKLLCIEVAINIFGVLDWFMHLSIKVSNYLFDITNYSLSGSFGEVYIYESMAIVYYLAAILILRGSIQDERTPFIVSFIINGCRLIFSSKDHT